MTKPEPVQGRRLPETHFGLLPEGDIRPGDYWKYVNDDGVSMKPPEGVKGASGNLTQTVWGYMSPDGNGVGTLMIHTVREHEDGTISVISGDGSSNSVLHGGGAQHKQWHGYVDHGVWNHV